MKKRLLTLLALGVFSLTSCGGANGEIESSMDPKSVTIGILQPVEHEALGAAREGFIKGLADNGYGNANIVYRNAGGNDASLTTMAKNLVDTSTLTLGIGTGASLALKGMQDNAGLKKPILFTAVTDPVQAGLVASKENKTGFICGTTDANPVEEQIAIIKEFKKDATSVGIIYTQTEVNSKVQADQAKAAIEARGMTANIKTCHNSSDIKATALALADANVDAIYVPTDNNIAANMNAIKDATTNKGILVVAGEENLVKNGAHVTLSIDYFGLGVATGKMAAQILSAEKKPTDFPVVPVASSECAYCFSEANLASAGLTMPEDLLEAHEWTNLDK